MAYYRFVIVIEVHDANREMKRHFERRLLRESVYRFLHKEIKILVTKVPELVVTNWEIGCHESRSYKTFRGAQL